MTFQLAPVLPFLAERLRIEVADLLTMPALTVARIFGQHVLLFLDERALNPALAASMTKAEKMAFPSIAEAAKLAGYRAG